MCEYNGIKESVGMICDRFESVIYFVPCEVIDVAWLRMKS